MPYKSLAQIKYMHANHPEIAERWDKKYRTPKKLPKHVAVKKTTVVKKNKKTMVKRTKKTYKK